MDTALLFYKQNFYTAVKSDKKMTKSGYNQKPPIQENDSLF